MAPASILILWRDWTMMIHDHNYSVANIISQLGIFSDLATEYLREVFYGGRQFP